MTTKLKKWFAEHGALFAVAVAYFAAHMVANAHYGFHRDELQFIADSKRLAFGFVPYPPVTAFMASVARNLFGESLVAYRAFSALTHAMILFIAGLIARDLGGKGFSRVLAAVACACAPVMLFSGSVLMYTAFDYLAWVLVAFFLVRVLKGDARCWIGVGFSVGFGMMTKYSIFFLVVSMALALAALPERRLFASRYFALAVTIAIAIFLPNLLWLARHEFVTWDFLKHIHARDIEWGRAEGFLGDQLSDCMGFSAVPLALAGAWFLFRDQAMRRYRSIVLWTILAVAVFAVMRGRGYYTGALYVPLVAAGSVFAERAIERLASRARRSLAASLVAGFLALSAIGTAAIVLPLAPAGSRWFTFMLSINDTYAEQFGWEELAFDAALVRDSLVRAERDTFGILAANYGEAGAIDFYGRRYGLPRAMCGTNSFYDEGFDPNEPAVILAVGFDRTFLERFFGSVEVVAHSRNALDLANEETTWHRDIYLCRKPNFVWKDFWQKIRNFG